MKKIYFVLVLLFVSVLFVNESFAAEGDVWLIPANNKNIMPSQSFDIEVHMDTAGKNIGAFNMFFDFNPYDVNISTSTGSDGISLGLNTSSYSILANPNDISNGHYRFAGITATNYANGSDVHLATIHVKATQEFSSGTSKLSLRVNELANDLGVSLTLGTSTDAMITSNKVNTPIYRLYNTRTGAQLYTRGDADKDKILAKYPDFEFTDNAPAFYASLTDDGTTPIYRLYNTRTGAQLYTVGMADRDKILAKWHDFEFTDNMPAFYASAN